LIAVGFRGWGVASHIRNRWPAGRLRPHADRRVDSPAL